MTQQINIQIPQQNLQVPLPALLTLLGSTSQPASTNLILPAEFGAPLQGGFYAGPHWEDGKLIHLIAGEDLGDHEWEDAKTQASDYLGGGFEDWFLPEKAHLMIAQIYASDKFEKVYHWSATPYGTDDAWRVDFKYGFVCLNYRYLEFRVRPFRRLSL